MAKKTKQQIMPVSPIPTELSSSIRLPSYLAVSLLALGLVLLLRGHTEDIYLYLWLFGILSIQLINILLDEQGPWRGSQELLLGIVQLGMWALLPIFGWSETLAIQIVGLFFLLLAAMLIHIRFPRLPVLAIMISFLLVPLLQLIFQADNIGLLAVLLVLCYAAVWLGYENYLLNYGKSDDFIEQEACSEEKSSVWEQSTANQESNSDGSNMPQIDSNKNILIVEDNMINQQVVVEMLQPLNAEISIADNGEQALKMVLAEPFDLILMDIQMPVMDGYEVTRRIRRFEQFRELPIIAMTAYAMQEDRARCLAAGMNDHISKPFEPELFYQTLGKWLNLSIDDMDKHIERIPKTPSVDKEVLYPAGIEHRVGLQKVLNNHALYNKLMLEFYQDFKDSLNILKVQLKNGQEQMACRLLHRLKGASGNIGAIRLYQSTKNLEQQLKTKQSCDMDEFSAAFSEVMDGLVVIQDASQESVEGPGSIDYKALKPLLQELSQYLQEANPQAVELLPKIKTAAQGNIADLLKILTENIYTFQFEEAEITLQQINLKLEHMENVMGGL